MKRHRFAIPLIPLLLAALLMLATPVTSVAQTATPSAASPADSPTTEPPTFSVAPEGGADLSPMHLKADAGSSAEAMLVVSNGGHSSIDLKTFAVAVTTAINGGYQVLPEGNGSHGQVTWLSVPDKEYTLAPGEKIELPVRLIVPAGTEAGEYMAALATETTKSEPVAGSGTFRQIIRKVNAVVITVPGAVHASFELGAPTLVRGDGATTIIVPIANTGNARVRPAGTIMIKSGKDGNVVKIPVRLNSVYAWDTTTIQQTFSQALADGEYTVTVQLTDEATGATGKRTATATVAPQPTATPGA
jgi:hypothetical protein